MDRHELRQPVTAIRATAQLALLKLARAAEADAATTRQYLEVIIAETRRLEALLAEGTGTREQGTVGWLTSGLGGRPVSTCP